MTTFPAPPQRAEKTSVARSYGPSEPALRRPARPGCPTPRKRKPNATSTSQPTSQSPSAPKYAVDGRHDTGSDSVSTAAVGDFVPVRRVPDTGSCRTPWPRRGGAGGGEDYERAILAHKNSRVKRDCQHRFRLREVPGLTGPSLLGVSPASDPRSTAHSKSLEPLGSVSYKETNDVPSISFFVNVSEVDPERVLVPQVLYVSCL